MAVPRSYSSGSAAGGRSVAELRIGGRRRVVRAFDLDFGDVRQSAVAVLALELEGVVRRGGLEIDDDAERVVDRLHVTRGGITGTVHDDASGVRSIAADRDLRVRI